MGNLIVQEWSRRAIHDTVESIVREPGYQRSVLGSLLGRALVAIVDGINRLIEAAKSIPGGRTTVIIVILLIVTLIIARILLNADWQDDEFSRRRGRAGRTPRTDPWLEAQRLAALGDHTGAAHALYQAVLRRLAGSEGIRLHDSKTSGDYSRELRRRGSLAAVAFQQFGRRFDRVIFGVGQCSPGEFDAMLQEAMAVEQASSIAPRRVA